MKIRYFISSCVVISVFLFSSRSYASSSDDWHEKLQKYRNEQVKYCQAGLGSLRGTCLENLTRILNSTGSRLTKCIQELREKLPKRDGKQCTSLADILMHSAINNSTYKDKKFCIQQCYVIFKEIDPLLNAFLWGMDKVNSELVSDFTCEWSLIKRECTTLKHTAQAYLSFFDPIKTQLFLHDNDYDKVRKFLFGQHSTIDSHSKSVLGMHEFLESVFSLVHDTSKRIKKADSWMPGLKKASYSNSLPQECSDPRETRLNSNATYSTWRVICSFFTGSSIGYCVGIGTVALAYFLTVKFWPKMLWKLHTGGNTQDAAILYLCKQALLCKSGKITPLEYEKRKQNVLQTFDAVHQAEIEAFLSSVYKDIVVLSDNAVN